jgi:hypothetical protein
MLAEIAGSEAVERVQGFGFEEGHGKGPAASNFFELIRSSISRVKEYGGTDASLLRKVSGDCGFDFSSLGTDRGI